MGFAEPDPMSKVIFDDEIENELLERKRRLIGKETVTVKSEQN